jgi:peptidoglycan/LPS O-acetylase OafA/YrhL
VLAVVLYHADLFQMQAGFVGVDIFFVISGFLISRIIVQDFAAGRFSLLGFYERRVRRILPSLTLMAGTVLAVAWYVLMPHDYARLARSTVATALFASNVFFWHQQGYFAPAAAEQPLLHTWSLGIEEQFYILFPVLVWSVQRFAPRALFMIIAVLALTSFGLAAAGAFLKPSATFYLLPTRAWELFAGSLLALRLPARPSVASARWALSLLALALLLGPIWLYPPWIAFPGLAAVPPVVGAVLVIWLGGDGPAGRLLATQPMRFVGRISYAFYLWHFPLFALASYVHSSATSTAAHLSAVAAAFALAVLSTFLVEEPIRRGGQPRRFAVVFRGALASLLLATSGAVLASETVARAIYGPRAEGWSSMRSGSLSANSGLCMSFQGTRSDDPQCAIGMSDRPPSFALWGDSHAQAAHALFDGAARTSAVGGLLVGGYGCAPFGAPANPTCATINENVLANLQAFTSIRTVVLVAYWALYMEGSRLHDETVVGRRGGGEVAALHALIRRLEASGQSVVVVGPLPESAVDVPRLAYLRFRGLIGAEASQASLVAMQRLARVRTRLGQAVWRTQARVVWPTDFLCDNGICPLERAGAPMLDDDNHLSRNGAQILEGLAGEVLQIVARNSETSRPVFGQR